MENLINCGPLKRGALYYLCLVLVDVLHPWRGALQLPQPLTHTCWEDGSLMARFSSAQVNPFEGGGEMFSGLGSRRCSPTILAQTVAL